MCNKKEYGMLVAEKCTEILFTAIYVSKQNEKISLSWSLGSLTFRKH